jgi:DNA-directed RNA polymerase subunit RPC12/RpoP
MKKLLRLCEKKFILQGCYDSDSLVVGDGESFIFVCYNCNSIVNSKTELFKLTYLLCPNCGRSVKSDNFIDPFGFMATGEPYHHCPKCKIGVLDVEIIAHVRDNLQEVYPKIDEMVHGVISETGEVKVRGVLLFDGKLVLKNSPQDLKIGKPMLLKVVGIEKGWFDEEDFPPPPKEEQLIVKRVNLEFVRYLTENDFVRELHNATSENAT